MTHGGAAQLVHAPEHLLGVLRNAVQDGRLVQQALRRAFGARAVVAHDVDDECILRLAQLFDRIEDAADLEVGVRECSGIDLHHPGVESLLVGVEAVPGGDLRSLGAWCGACAVPGA
jgi:hypothetical protein